MIRECFLPRKIPAIQYHKTLLIFYFLHTAILQAIVTLRHRKLTGHVNDTFKEVADISESLSMDSFSLTKALV